MDRLFFFFLKFQLNIEHLPQLATMIVNQSPPMVQGTLFIKINNG